jgi:uncharacterized protein YggU (UPF0235/DUF167 family)
MSGRKIKIKVHANSSQEKILEVGDGLEVWLKEKPIEGKANLILNKILKKYIGKEVKLISGFNSKMKIFEVLE